MFNRFFSILGAFGILLLAGCASYPEAVQLPPDTPTVNYDQVVMAPEVHKGTLAQWGGVVAEVQNLAEQTMIEVVYYPLRGYGRPLLSKESAGRFRVYVDGFLDPIVYQQGRSVTFSGEVVGVEEGSVGEHQYLFPVLKAKGYHLWEDIERIDITTISPWPYPYYGYGGWYRGWYGYPYYPYSHQSYIIKRRRDYYQPPANSGNSSSNSSKPTLYKSTQQSSNRKPTSQVIKGGKKEP